MGFLDKVKEQAATGMAAAKDAAQKGQAKLDTMQANKHAEALLRDLGAAVYAQQSGRGTPETAGDIERIVGQLREHEQSQGAIQLTATAQNVEAGAVGQPIAPAYDAAAAGGAPPPPPPSGVSV